MTTIFVRVLSEELWFGAWAPIEAMQRDASEVIFVLADNDLTAEDEYEFFEPGTAVRVEKFTDKQGIEFLGAVESVNADTNRSLVIA